MAEKTYAGSTVTVTDEGYLEDMTVWNKEIAEEIAKEEGIELTEKHFALFEFLREKVEKGEMLTIRSSPTAYLFTTQMSRRSSDDELGAPTSYS